MIGPKIQKHDTVFRTLILARTKLESTLRHLARGDNITSLEYAFKIPKNTIQTFPTQVLTAIYEVLNSI